MAQFVNMYKVELSNGVAPVVSLRQIFYGDVAANRIGAIVQMNGAPVTLGGTCSGTAILADGSTVALTGTVSGNEAYVVLPAGCYSMEGQIQVFVKLTVSGVTTTLLAAVGTVRLTETDQIIDPGTIIPSVSALITSIEDAIASIPADYSALLGSVAHTFSSSESYTAGKYVWYNGELYRFNADHPAGAWIGTDAARYTTTDEFPLMQQALGTKADAAEVADLKSALENTSSSKIIEFTSGYSIDTHGSTVDVTNIMPTNGFAYALLNVSEGDVFTLNGSGGAYSLLWCWLDSNGGILTRSAANATATDLIIIAPAKSAKLIINNKDISIPSYYGYKPDRKIESIDADIDYSQNAISELQEKLSGYKDINLDFVYGVFEANGYASPATSNYIHSPILPAGDYIVQPPAGYQCEIYKYNTDASGSSFLAWFTNKRNVKVTTSFVITIAKTPISGIPKSELETIKYSKLIQQFVGFPEFLDTVNKNSKARWNPKFSDYSFDSIFSLGNTYIQRTGLTQKVYDKNFGESPFAILFSADTTVLSNNEFRIQLASPFNLVGVSEFLIPIYLEDPSKVSNITLYVEKTSGAAWNRSIGGSTLKKGWNYKRLFTINSNVSVWETTSLLRVVCTYNTAATDVYIADIIAVRPAKGKLIFVDDHGYSNFYTAAYPQLKALSVPVTWAIQPGALGASGGVAGKLTQTQIDEMASDPFCEFSFHSWKSDATSTMTEAQIMADTQKCVTYLKQHGILPSYFWRAAWTQNNAPNAAAAKYILQAYASPSENYGETVYPFSDRFNIVRTQLHGTSDFSSLFSKIQKTHCTVVVYTHDLDDTGGIHITSEEFAAFLTALSAAMNNGYVECTTYSRLCTKYGDNEPYILR